MTPNPAEAHILIVDDDERIRELLKKYLARQGFLVTSARNAEHARRLLAGLEFDLIVMDVMMPGESGIELTRSLRAESATPVLLLTAKGAARDRIDGLEAGADDYLAKPFEPKELLLRINAILRRVSALPPQREALKTLQIGALRYDIDRAELWHGDTQVRLTSTEAALMRLLARQPNEPVTRSDLVTTLSQGGETVQERAVDVQVTRLRRKIEPDPKQPRYLQTVRGSGYMLSPD